MKRFVLMVGMVTFSFWMAGCSGDSKSMNPTETIRALKPGGGGQLQPFNPGTGRYIPGK